MTIDYKAFYDRLVAEVANPPLLPVDTQVKDALELRAALKKGGTIRLAPGTYVGNWVLDADGTVLLGLDAAELAPEDPLEPTIWNVASKTRVDAVIVVNGAPDRECIVVGRHDATDPAAQPSDVTIYRCLVEAGAKGGHRGIALHGSNLSVTNCKIVGFWEAGRDSQGIWGNNGPGPYTITDNYIEASGENILFGGSDPSIQGMVPADILIARNTLSKPAAWKTNGATVKNNLELKNARRVTIENNVIDGWWPPNQAAPVQFTPRNQDGNAPWCVVEDVVFTGNVIKNAPGGFAINILGTDNDNPSGQTKNITISRNLFTDSQSGIQVVGYVAGALVIDHNTFPAIKSKLFSFDARPATLTPLVFTNNVAKGGTYAITGDGDPTTPFGLPVLLQFCNIVDWSNNLIAESFVTDPQGHRVPAHQWPLGQNVLTNAALTALLDPVTFKTLNGTAGY